MLAGLLTAGHSPQRYACSRESIEALDSKGNASGNGWPTLKKYFVRF